MLVIPAAGSAGGRWCWCTLVNPVWALSYYNYAGAGEAAEVDW